MLESSQKWELFGYDMRSLGRHWLGAWRNLLWAHDSPIRQRFDDAVCLRREDSEVYYQAGKRSETGGTVYSAILLPEELVLSKMLDLPAAVEGDLEVVLALECSAHSPFSADDTGYGWHIAHRDESKISVVLAIISKSSAMAYLASKFDIHDPRQQEVWVLIDGETLVIRGFGEGLRAANYRKRLLRVAVMLTICALLILSIAAVAAGVKALELQRVEEMAATTEMESQDAARMRSSLGLANEMIVAANEIAKAYPNPHIEISRLTNLLKDGEFVQRLSIKGLEVDLQGGAEDAASVMERLAGQSEYAEVTAPRAITRVRGTEGESFYLNIRLREAPLQ
jgi:hypothetical protein